MCTLVACHKSTATDLSAGTVSYGFLCLTVTIQDASLRTVEVTGFGLTDQVAAVQLVGGMSLYYSEAGCLMEGPGDASGPVDVLGRQEVNYIVDGHCHKQGWGCLWR